MFSATLVVGETFSQLGGSERIRTSIGPLKRRGSSTVRRRFRTLVRAAGIEPATYRLRGECSGLLSYARKLWSRREGSNFRPFGYRPNALSQLSYSGIFQGPTLTRTRGLQPLVRFLNFGPSWCPATDSNRALLFVGQTLSTNSTSRAKLWWLRLGSNQRPRRYEHLALPTELQSHGWPGRTRTCTWAH